MLRALSGQEAPRPLVGALYRETEGNPFFVEEVFQHLAEEEKLFDAKGRWRSDLEVSELDVPEGIRLIIGRRLERVSEKCRRVLTSAAVIGGAFSFELLEALGDPSTDSGQAVDPDALLDAVDEAERANLIASADDDVEARFTFGHELIRQTLLSGVSLPRRQRLHLRVAEAMERLYARALEERAADLAHHLSRAGTAADPQKTGHYLTLAGDRAQAMAAFEDALRLYESALSLQPDDDKRGRADLRFKRGLALRSLGRWDEALADWRQALDAFEELGDAEAVGRTSSDITLQLVWGGRLLEALEISRRGLIALGERVSTDRCQLLAMAGIPLSMAGSHKASASMIGEAVAMARELGDQHLLGWALEWKGFHHWNYMQMPEAIDSALPGAELLRSAGDLWGLADALWVTEIGQVYLGRLDEASKTGEELEPLAARLGHLGALVIAGWLRGFRELAGTADLDRFEECAREGLELGRSIGFPWFSQSYTFIGQAHFWRGRWEEALENSQEAARLEPPGFYAGADWGFLFLFKAYSSDRDEALGMLREKVGDLPRRGGTNGIGAWTMLLRVVEGLAVLGERDEAGRYHHDDRGSDAVDVFQHCLIPACSPRAESPDR